MSLFILSIPSIPFNFPQLRFAPSNLLQAFGEGFQKARARRGTEFAERLGLDLAYALTRHVEILSYLFERVLLARRAQAVSEFDDDLFARTQGREHGVGHCTQIRRDDRI